MSVGLFVCVSVCTFITCALGVIIWALVSLYLKAVAPMWLVKVWLLWLRVIFRPEMAGGDLCISLEAWQPIE